MTRDDVLALLQQGQGQRIEFRPERVTPGRLANTPMALANADGGTVLLGVERNGEVVGLKDPATARDKAMQLPSSAARPSSPLSQVVEVLQKRGCLTADGGLTNAGILLFGREPSRFVQGCEVILVRYAGTEMGDR